MIKWFWILLGLVVLFFTFFAWSVSSYGFLMPWVGGGLMLLAVVVYFRNPHR